MTKKEAQEQLKEFFKHYPMLTFTITEYGEEEWVAQCNEVDGIITGGRGLDLSYMEALMQDAILTAAGIPEEFSADMLKRVYGPDLIQQSASQNTIQDSAVSVTTFPSIYSINVQSEYAR